MALMTRKAFSVPHRATTAGIWVGQLTRCVDQIAIPLIRTVSTGRLIAGESAPARGKNVVQSTRCFAIGPVVAHHQKKRFLTRACAVLFTTDMPEASGPMAYRLARRPSPARTQASLPSWPYALGRTRQSSLAKAQYLFKAGSLCCVNILHLSLLMIQQ